MFESCVREGKLPPDFSGTDEHQVSLTLHGQIQDPFFLRFLEQLGAETQVSFDTRDLVALDAIYRERSVPEPVRDRLSALQGMGAIEKVGRKHILARAAERGLGNVEIITCDVNRLELNTTFDRVVSIEMFEQASRILRARYAGPGKTGATGSVRG